MLNEWERMNERERMTEPEQQRWRETEIKDTYTYKRQNGTYQGRDAERQGHRVKSREREFPGGPVVRIGTFCRGPQVPS